MMTSQRALLLGLSILCAAGANIEANVVMTEYGNENVLSELDMTTTHSADKNVATSIGIPTQEDHPVNIIVLGRSGSGVSSTVRDLIGPLTKCEKTDGAEENLQNIYEYTISNIPGANSAIKLVEIPGFFDGRTLEQESQILATLKSYVSKVGGGPIIFLALSRFDDNHFAGSHSPFVQFLNRIELFGQEFWGKFFRNNMNINFLLTRFMSETKRNQRRPADKINSFRRTIEEFTSFPPPYRIVVGDSYAQSDYNAKEENGYYVLPNREHYPKNIWDAMISSTTTGADNQTSSILDAIRDNREVEMTCKAKLIPADWDEYNADVDAFLYLLQQQRNLTIEQNEVNLNIEEVFDEFPVVPDQVNGIIQKTALQLYLQTENITTIQMDIPTNYTDRAAFFQKSSLISSTYPAVLLNFAFGLEMPEYVQPLTVGYGYDVLADELLLQSPFKTITSLPSPIGYRLPNYMKCKRFPVHEIQAFQSYAQNMSEYFEERLKHLKFATKEDINIEKFTGSGEGGFNLAPEEGDGTAMLTAVKQVRVLKCELSEVSYWGDLDNEFVENINALDPVDLYSRDSIMDWEMFFRKYGTHIVVQVYGGGKLVGSIFVTDLERVFDSRSRIDDTLDSILKFSNLRKPGLGKPSYDLFGGDVSKSNSSQLYDMPENQRDRILREWEESLNSNFDMLKSEFALERISTVVKEKIDSKKAEMVDEAMELFLRGELKRQRKRGTTLGGNGESRGITKKPVRLPPPTQSSRYIRPRNGLPPTFPTRSSSQPFYNSPLTTSNQTNSEGMFRTQLQNANLTINILEHSLEKKRRNDMRLHRQQLMELEKRHHESLSTLKEKTFQTFQNVRKLNETGYAQHKIKLKTINEEKEQDRVNLQSLLDTIQHTDREETIKHQLYLNELERQRKQHERNQVLKRCWSFLWLNPYCWTRSGRTQMG